MIVLHTLSGTILKLGPLTLNWYGISYILGCGMGYFIGRLRVKESWRGFSAQLLEDLLFYVMLGVILGGRAGYVLFYGFDGFLADPFSILRVWEGGMSFHGGLLGVIAATWLWSVRNDRKDLDSLDFISQLYQAFLEGVVLAGLLWWYSKRQRPTGAVSGFFVLGYGVQRFFVEFFREPDQQLGFVALQWMTMGQLLCLPMITFGSWLMWFSYRRGR